MHTLPCKLWVANNVYVCRSLKYGLFQSFVSMASVRQNSSGISRAFSRLSCSSLWYRMFSGRLYVFLVSSMKRVGPVRASVPVRVPYGATVLDLPQDIFPFVSCPSLPSPATNSHLSKILLHVIKPSHFGSANTPSSFRFAPIQFF
jgi:hypothetical protein